MPDKVSRPDSIRQLTGFPTAVKNVPAVWPQGPSPDKISLLFKYNKQSLYHDAPTPWTYGSNPFGILPNKQPFIYRYPDEAQKSFFNELKPAVRTMADAAGVNQNSIDDINRVSKFLFTSNGILFLTKQALLQAYQPYPETSIYNPLETLVATVRPVGFGLIDRPKRHLDADDPLGALGIGRGTLPGAIVGYGAGSATTGAATGIQNLLSKLGLGSRTKPQQLPITANDGKAGLLRVPTGNRAKAVLDTKWVSGDILNRLSNMIKKSVDPLVPSFVPRKAPNTDYRQDEATYDGMLKDMMYRLNAVGRDGDPYSSATFVRWTGPTLKSTDKSYGYFYPEGYGKTYAATFTRDTYYTYFGLGKQIDGKKVGYSVGKDSDISDLLGFKLGGSGASALGGLAIGLAKNLAADFGILPGSGPVNDPANKYGKHVGRDSTDPDTYKWSEILVNYSNYIADDGTHFLSKMSNQTAPYGFQVKAINDGMRAAIDKIRKSGAYDMDVYSDSRIITSGYSTTPTSDGYGKISSMQPANGKSINDGTAAAQYRDGNSSVKFRNITIPKTVDKSIKSENGQNLRMATSFTSDGINLLSVLDKTRATAPLNREAAANLSNMYPGWTEYLPYQDDLIAFFFYDVVNEKYIPFRATIKGLSEGNTAFWDELRFIGRADQLYSYNGFSRTLSFTFNVVINSVTELLPTWKRINYIASCVKPSNYTKSDVAGKRYSNFLVPPMFMVTIGDLYKFQPIVITSLNVNIPDDASWETLSEYSTAGKWSFLNGMISSPNVGKNFAQVPKEVEIAVTCNLLEKERAMVGGCHFGHAPREDRFDIYAGNDRFLASNSDAPYMPGLTTFHKEMVEFSETGGTSTGSPPTSATTANPASRTLASAGGVANAAKSAAGSATTAASKAATSIPSTTGNIASRGKPFTVPGTTVTGIDFSQK